MTRKTDEQQNLLTEVKELRIKLEEAEETLNAIRCGGVDAMVVSSPRGEQVFMLKGEEHTYRVLVEAMSEGAATLSNDGTILYCNSNLASIVKTPLEKLIGTPFRSLITPSSLPLFDTIFRESLRGGKGELILMAGDGTNVPVYFSGSSMKSNDTKIVCAIVTDLTRQKLDEKLVTSGRLATAILEQAGEVILVSDETGHIIRANQMAQKILSINATRQHFDEVLTLRKFTNGQIFSISETLRGNTQQNTEVSLDQRNGKKLSFLLGNSPLVSTEGLIIGTVSTLTDITERKRAEQALHESEERYRTILQTAMDGFWITDLQGQLQEVNETYCRMSGYTKQELLTMRIPDLELVEPARVVAKRIEEIVAKGNDRFESKHRCKDGSTFDVEVNVLYQPTEGGRLVVFLHDLTERKKLQVQLMAQDRLVSIGQLVAGVAHEINNPLSVVIGYSQLLLKRELPDDVMADLKVVNDEAQRTVRIVKNLLTFARQQPEGKAPVDINEQLQRVLDLRKHEQKVNNIQVITRFASDLPPVLGNASQLQQVFFNIVINAEFFMLEAHQKGNLTITTESTEDVVRCSFTDDGLGMSVKAMRSVFTPFFTTKAVGKGTGLGLSICHGIVTEHGGRIYAESELGKGATFIVELPIPEAMASREAVR